jgi:DNA-binding response OmpR family regulator
MPRFVTEARFRAVLTDELNILAVDDDPIQREFCSVYLSTPTASVTTTESAEAGLALLDVRRFDIALIDVEMPGLNGIEMVRRLRADKRFDGMPIIVVTGLEDIESIDLAYEVGATAFICKPVNWRLLSHQVKFHLRAHKALRREGAAHV